MCVVNMRRPSSKYKVKIGGDEEEGERGPKQTASCLLCNDCIEHRARRKNRPIILSYCSRLL